MTTAAARFRRLTTVLPRLAAGRDVRIDELAAQAGVPATTLMADLRALAERYDVPAGFVEGVAVLVDGDTVSVRTDHFLRPMRLTAAELCALELGLSLLARERDGDDRVAVDHLREAVTSLIVSLPRDEVYAGLRDGALVDRGGSSTLPQLRRAVRQQNVITIGYRSGTATEDDERAIQPYALLHSRGSWFVMAWCERSDAMRMFRADRITAARDSGRRFERPSDFRIEDFMVDGKPFINSGPPPQLVIRYGPAIARWIAERDGLPLDDDGTAVRTMPLADREWAIRHVLQYGPDAEIVEPVDLRAEVVERLRWILQRQ